MIISGSMKTDVGEPRVIFEATPGFVTVLRHQTTESLDCRWPFWRWVAGDSELPQRLKGSLLVPV